MAWIGQCNVSTQVVDGDHVAGTCTTHGWQGTKHFGMNGQVPAEAETLQHVAENSTRK